MDRSLLIPLLVFSLLSVILLVRKLAARDPGRPWAMVLVRFWYGPRTDVVNLTKPELLDSGLRSVTWGFIFMSVFFFVGLLGRFLYSGTDWPYGFFVLLFFCSFFAGMGLLGGTYLLVRAGIRPRNWVSPKQ